MSPTHPPPVCQNPWVRSLRDGETGPWEDLTHELEPLLRSQIARFLRCPVRAPEVDDCVNEVWLRVFKYRERIPDVEGDADARVSLRRWLCKVARNVTHDWREKRSPTVGLPPGDGSSAKPLDPPMIGPSVGSEIGWRSLYQHIRDELDPLDVQIIDHYLEGMTYAEIGKAIGRASETVRERMAKIREQINRLLGRWGGR